MESDRSILIKLERMPVVILVSAFLSGIGIPLAFLGPFEKNIESPDTLFKISVVVVACLSIGAYIYANACIAKLKKRNPVSI